VQGGTANQAGNTIKQRKRELNKGIGQGKCRTVNSKGRFCEFIRNTEKQREKELN
jgi:hypothetical protein